MKNLRRIEDMFKKEFLLGIDIEEIITTTILNSKFLIVYMPYRENLEEPVREDEIDALLEKNGIETKYLWETGTESANHPFCPNGMVSVLIFREDDEKGYNEYLDQTGCRVDYEEEIHQQRWF